MNSYETNTVMYTTLCFLKFYMDYKLHSILDIDVSKYAAQLITWYSVCYYV